MWGPASSPPENKKSSDQTMIRIKGDAIFALVLFAVFSFGTYQSLVMDNAVGGDTDVGAAFFPFWVCIFIQVLTMIVFIGGIRAAGDAEGAAAGAPPMRQRAELFVGILALLFFYILTMEMVGFIVSSAVFLILVHQLLVFSTSRHLSPAKELAFAAGFFAVLSVVLYFLFNTVFALALP